MHNFIQLFDEQLVVIYQAKFVVVSFDKCHDVFFIPDFIFCQASMKTIAIN